MRHYNAVIIGSGQGGTPLAKKLAKKGWKTVLIEKESIGGTCINVGCTPTKTMIASAKTAYTVTQAIKYGVETTGLKINIDTILARKDKIVKSFRNGSQLGLEHTENLELLFGTASFIGEKKLQVLLNDGGEVQLTADKIFIDTGTSAAIPAIAGLTETGYLTSTSLMELPQIPEHLLIIGGGYIGLEFGQMYKRFGSKVTILEYSQRFLSREDEDVADEVMKFLQAEEITIVTNVQVQQVHKNGDNIVANVVVNEGEKEILCTHILVSAGRTPNTDLLNLEAAGISTDERGYIITNDKLETTAKDIYAIGDVKGGPEFTHIAYNDYIIIYNNLIEGKEENIKDRLVPYTMFTDPQLGRVGITEQEGLKKGLNIKVGKLSMAHVARAIETGDTRGIMKAVVDAESGAILGVAIVGQEGGEVMSVLQMAMTGGITWQQLKNMVFAHPLYAESINNLFMQLEQSND
ncbi:MAG: mercuric reductase [Phormidesmis sp. FL-bin-119]|nr:mercuric reductase [Pedobacter sp.]